MAFITTGLTGGGVTTHYKFQYDDSLQKTGANPTGIEPARTNAVIAACENDYNLMKGWFGGGVNVTGMTVQVTTQGGGAAWNGSSTSSTITLKPGNNTDPNFLRYLIIAEVTEIFMMTQNKGWFQSGNEGSKGEGLSRFLSAQFLIANGLGFGLQSGFTVANLWLNSPRQDFVNNAPDDFSPDATNGCTTLFVYYLHDQLAFSIPAIVGAAANTLAGVYTNLTGDSSDPFPFFKQLMDNAFPSQTTSAVPGPNGDNPFPLGMLAFWVDKGSFGRDEVHDLINSPSHGRYSNAFWLVLEGFNKKSFSNLGIGAPNLAGTFAALPQITLPLNGAGVEFENFANDTIPQRIRFPYDVVFTNATLGAFPNPGDDPILKVLSATLTVSGALLPGAAALTEFELVSGADPYYNNIDPQQNNVFWLSQDVRVFTVTPQKNNAPVAGAPAFGSNTPAGAYTYLQSVLAHLNNPNNHFTDGTVDPFRNGTIPQPSDSLQGDSSVSAFTLSFSPFGLLNNYNFAIARVRLKGSAGPAGEAKNVKVFFRVWSTQTADTDFQPNSTYLSHLVGGKPAWPLPAPDNHTLPFFATGNTPNLSDPNNPEYGASGINNKTIQINTGDTAWAYYGCFLNFFDPSNVVNGQPVQAILAGTHHCLVAQIAYDDAPIINANGVTASPENSDKLAQRNMQVTLSDNPGPAETHVIPQTFDIRPSQTLAAAPGLLLNYPDELMIDWGNTPAGSVGHIYWPQVSASKVLDLANRLYSTHLLSASDAHTIDITVSHGVSYVPIPPGIKENLASLLTVDLPLTVKTGQEINIIVRRVSTRRMVVDVPPPPPPPIKLAMDENTTAVGNANTQSFESRVIGRVMRNWRYVVGTFQVKIPVTTKEVMLYPEENTLAILKWRYLQMAATNRWYPVLARYIAIVSARIAGLGGNPDAIPPSPTGAPLPHEHRPGEKEMVLEFCGKVSQVIYDCFGDLVGFTLKDCEKQRFFKVHERAVGELALRALKERFELCVIVEVEDSHEHEHDHEKEHDHDRDQDHEHEHKPEREYKIVRLTIKG